MDDQKRALALSLLTWLLLLVTACRTATTPSEATPLPEISTSDLTSLTTATVPPPTPTISPSPTISPDPTATVTPPAEPTPSVMLAEQIAYISGSPYAVVEITPLVPPECCPTISPDGQKVAFGTYMINPQKIYVQNSDGSDLTEVSSLEIGHGDGPFPDPVWSPDGQYLAFVNYDEGIYLVKADGTNLTRLEPEGFDPAWSPDGTSLAFASWDRDIYVMDSAGRQPRQLTSGEAFEQRPAWSPDGQSIAFVSDSYDHDVNYEIYVMNSDGSNQRRLTNNTANDWGPVFSPDGRYIVFSSDRDGHNGIYVMNSDGSEQRWLMAAEAPQRWRPDTTRVRFVEGVQEVPPLPEEISQGVVFTLAQQFRVNPDEIELVSWQQTTWPNGCLGIDRRQPCPQVETPGYRLRLKIKGVPYEFRSQAGDPLDLRLAVGPAVDIEEVLLWEGEPALFGGAEEGSCLSFSLSAAGQGSLGVCDGPQRGVELTGEQFAQPQVWQDWLTRFAPFEAETVGGRVVFQGQGAETASPAWQRALAAWAQLAALELNDGRSGASWGAALAWQQPLPERPGYCQFLSVQSYGWAYASIALCEGGDPENLGQGWIQPAAWEQFDDWFYNRAPVTHQNLSFFGVGSQEMSQVEVSDTEQWATTLYNNLVAMSSHPFPKDAAEAHPGPLAEVANLALLEANGVAVAGQVVYVTDNAGLHLLDISDPATPQKIGFYPAEGTPGVVVASDMAYLMSGGKLHLIDISDPTAPQQVGGYSLPSGANHLAVVGQTLYLGAGQGGFIILDVSDPAAPREISRTAGNTSKVAVLGTTAYAVDGMDLLRLLDVSDPTRPHLLGAFRPGDVITDLLVGPSPTDPSVTLAYLGTLGLGVRIVNVSNPAGPQEIGVYPSRGSAYSLALAGNRLYVANGWGAGGLSLVDITNPAAPAEASFIPPAAQAWDSFVDMAAVPVADGVKVYIANRFEGLLIYSDIPAAISPASESAVAQERRDSQGRGLLTFFPLPQLDGYVRALALDRAGRVWVAAVLNLYLLDPASSAPTWTNVTSSMGGPTGVEALLIDDRGQIWAGSRSGVSIFDGESWTTYDAADGLGDDWVHALALDAAGRLWAGTDKGVSQFDGDTWSEIVAAPVPVLALAIDSVGQVWAGSTSGVSVFDGSTWTACSTAGDFALMYVNAIAPDPERNIWVASGACFLAPGDCTNTGLSKFDGQNWTNYLQTYFRDYSGSGPVFAVNFDRDGYGWVGLDSGFMRFDPQTLPAGAQDDDPAWATYPEFTEGVGQVHAITFDRAGNVWLGSSNGVARLNEQ